MKRIKNNSLRIAILLITIGSVVILYWFGFHKQFDKKSIPENTDGIVMVDIKTIRNHFIFSCLKKPSQWELGSNNSKKRFDFSNYGIETPDYLSFFHIQNQPLNQWCCTAIVENETKFNKSLLNSHFVKIESGKSFVGYYSKTLNTYILRYANQILYCVNTSNNYQTFIRIAEDLFVKHHYFDSKKIEKTINTSDAVTIWIKKNNLLNDDGIITISLQEDEIVAEGQLDLKPKYRKNLPFVQHPNALLSLGFNFEIIRYQDIFKNNKANINKIIGFNLDSILIHNPKQTELVFHSILEKKNTAISYDYDDDFNPIKKAVVHTTREPSFYFSIQTDDSEKIYDYLKNQKVIDNHQVFVNFPLAVTQTSVKNNSLLLEANLSKVQSSKSIHSKTGYLQINLNKLQPKDWRFLIAKNKNFALLKPFETIQINLIQKNNLGYFQASIKSKTGKSLLEISN